MMLARLPANNWPRPIAFTMLALLFCGGLLGGVSSSFAGAWTGRVIDRQTGRPVKEVIVVRARKFVPPDQHDDSRQIVSSFALTDREGRFQVDDPVIVEPTDSGKWVPSNREEQCLLYRPGYQAVPGAVDTASIAIERVPTSIHERRAALQAFLAVVSVNSPSGIGHPEVRDIAQREYEFTAGPKEILIQPKLPIAFHVGPTTRYVDNMTTSIGKLEIPACQCGKAAPVASPVGTRTGGAVPAGATMPMTMRPQPVKKMPQGLSNEALIELLQHDSNGSIRSQAAHELGRRGAVEAVPALLEVAGRGGPTLAASCAVSCIGMPALPYIEGAIEQEDFPTMRRIPFVLRRFPSETAYPLLVRLASSPDEQTRVQALSALKNIRRPESLPLFLEAAVDKQITVRRVGREALKDIDEADIPALRSAMAHHDVAVRRLAMTLLSENFPEQAGDILAQAVSAGDGRDQLDAARLAGLIDPQHAITILETALASNNRKMRRAVLPLAERRDVPEGGKRLIQEIERGEDDSFTMDALKALCRRNDSESLAFVQAYLQRHPSGFTYDALLPSLIGGSNPDAMAIVQPALKMDSPKLRQDALLVLGGIATPEALAVVGGYANDPDPGVRKAAFAALTQAGGKALAQIDHLMKDKSVYLRWRACRLLGNITAGQKGVEDGDRLVPVVIKMLQTSLKDPAPEVRLTAVESLGVLDRREGALVIVPLLDDCDPGIREAACQCLIELTGEDFGADQKAWRDWITHGPVR